MRYDYPELFCWLYEEHLGTRPTCLYQGALGLWDDWCEAMDDLDLGALTGWSDDALDAHWQQLYAYAYLDTMGHGIGLDDLPLPVPVQVLRDVLAPLEETWEYKVVNALEL